MPGPEPSTEPTRSRWRPQSIQELDPGLALRTGRTDAIVLLILWCMRRAFVPLLWLGFAFATLVVAVFRSQDAETVVDELAQLEGIGDYIGAILSPFAGVVAALFLRILVGLLALAAAFPLSLHRGTDDYGAKRRSTRYVHLWRDRLYLTRAYRALRWTWAVREVAAERAGRTGSILMACDPILRWIGIVAFVVFIGTILAT